MQTLETQRTDDTKILLVLPAHLASELLPVVHDIEEIVGICLQCLTTDVTVNDCQPLFNIYPKLLGVYELVEALISIPQHVESLSKKTYVYYLFDKDLQSILDLSKHYKWFTANRVCKEKRIRRVPADELNKKNFLDICRSIYALDPIQLNHIVEFERTYRSEDVLKWYSKDCFLYKVINNLYRSDTVCSDSLTEYVANDLTFNLHLLWQEQRAQYLAVSSTPIHLYRGLCVPDIEIDRIKASVGNYVLFNGFLSTSKSYEIARIFARNVLCEIEVDPQLDNIIFADITQYSNFDEQEVLFDLGSTFFLSSVHYDEENELWKIKLIGASESEIIENQLQYHNFTFDGQVQVFIGDQWLKFEQNDKAISYYEKSLLLIIDEEKKADAYYKLARVYLSNKKFEYAIRNALDAYRIKMSIHPPNPETIVKLLKVIGVSYACIKNYDSSMEYHLKYLILSESYRTIFDNTYYQNGSEENSELFSHDWDSSTFYEPALEHLLETLTKIRAKNNDTLAMIHLNIAILSDKIDFLNFGRTLEHFNMAKQLFATDSINLRYSIWYLAYTEPFFGEKNNVVLLYRKLLKLLDLNHSQIVMIVHYAIAKCYYENRKYNRALHHLHCALKINEKYSPDDDLNAKTLYMIGMIYQCDDRIDLALDFLNRSLLKHNTLTKINPTNYYDSSRIANITDAIGTCYLKKDDFRNYAMFTRISLEHYLAVMPNDLEKQAELNLRLALIHAQSEEYQLTTEYFERLLSNQERLMLHGDRHLLTNYMFVSTIYQSLNQLDSAIASSLKALNWLKTNSSPSLPYDSEILSIEDHLVFLYGETLDYRSALVHSCEMLHILEKMKNSSKQQIASVQNNIGWFYCQGEDLNNALISCEKSLQLFQECFPSSDTNQMNPELSYVLNSLGYIHLKSGDRTKALHYCQKSLETLERESETGQYMKSFADNYELLADIYMQYERQTLSFDYYMKALDLYRQLYATKKDDRDIQRVLTSMKNINEVEF
ncbi:unnamed protein product [Rotaria sp. Silwood2]|nr:unnamed protein product [Rotaria sp. Silwood2]